MKRDSVQFHWQDPLESSCYSTGVCLHGHTLHSKECLSFLPRYLGQAPGIRNLARRHENSVDYSRAYWTPPLAPAAALALEREQIGSLGLAPIVSLTDHDDIEAGLSLLVTRRRTDTPISLEWTAPYENSIFHLGIHNLPPKLERTWSAILAGYTEAPSEAFLPQILEALADLPEVLIVLNHPFWREEGVDEHTHLQALPALLDRCGEWLHAYELNGTRPWHENRDTIELSNVRGLPVISGGDRHACEPAACINLTNANTFAEFVGEIRNGESRVLFMPQYRDAIPSRVLSDIWDILRPYPEYPDRARWTDRVFYIGDDGVSRPVSEVWADRTPWELRAATAVVGLVATTHLRSAVRLIGNRATIAL